LVPEGSGGFLLEAEVRLDILFTLFVPPTSILSYLTEGDSFINFFLCKVLESLHVESCSCLRKEKFPVDVRFEWGLVGEIKFSEP
jgi:hypothetical protein